MLGELVSILRRGSENPDQLGSAIKQFLAAYDSVPYTTIEAGGVPWETVERLAYELRYYAPGEEADETLLDDRQAMDHIRTALSELS